MADKTSIKSAMVAKKAAAKVAAKPRKGSKAAKPRKTAPKAKSGKVAKPVLLSGGNPQIAMGYGDAPVQAYIAAMPGWKRDVGRRLDALITRTVPRVYKAIKWNSPLYGFEGEAGSLASIASRDTSKWLSSAARRCDPSRRARPRARTRATSTSTRTTSSTKPNSPPG
jgi:hypothetical protein